MRENEEKVVVSDKMGISPKTPNFTKNKNPKSCLLPLACRASALPLSWRTGKVKIVHTTYWCSGKEMDEEVA